MIPFSEALLLAVYIRKDSGFLGVGSGVLVLDPYDMAWCLLSVRIYSQIMSNLCKESDCFIESLFV